MPLSPVLRHTAGGWVVAYRSTTAQVEDTPGMHHLALLLARPREAIPALVLEQSTPRLDARARHDRCELHDARERARNGVGRALAAALDAIEVCHPTLGAHLRDSLSTGMHCCYDPPWS
jgi:hypothetical protein